jgi:hypothetical protein
MSYTEVLNNIRRVLVTEAGEENGFLHPDDSHLLAGTTYRESQQAAAGTAGLTIEGSWSAPQVGTYVHNVTQDFHAKILDVNGSTLTVQAPLGTTGHNWGAATDTQSEKLVDSGASFTSDVEVGMIAALRDLSDYAVITAIDSDSQLSLSKDLISSGDPYTIMRGFRQGDTVRLGTAVLDGSEGHVMTRIPVYWYDQNQDGDVMKWRVSSRPKAGLDPHPAFLRPDGTIRDAIYIGSFEGSIDEVDFSGRIATQYNMGSDKLISAGGFRPVVNGQRSEFRSLAENNGAGWQIIDWYSNWAWQLLMILDMQGLNSQDLIGDGLTTWNATNRNEWVDNISNQSVCHTGYSLRYGNHTVDEHTDSGNASGVLSWRGIENPYGNIWKWVDGVNYNDGRVYLNNDADSFADDTVTGYIDTGVTQPDSNGYISKIHDTPHGLLVAENNGSASTYLCDHYWYNPGWRVARAGGAVTNGDPAGFAALIAHNSSSARSTDRGSRVCFRN